MLTFQSLECISVKVYIFKNVSKTTLASGRESLQSYELSNISHFLENRLKDGGEFVSHAACVGC
jgi:hypothetical protein